jgi:hypothetical protein
MSMKILTLILLFFSSVLCAENMVKVVYRIQGPDIDEGAYAGLPRTVYRVGQLMGRVEESRDPDFGMHALIILNDRDVWMINRINDLGMHFTTPDPERGFRVPIVPSATPLQDRRAERFEIGRELDFMNEQAVEPVLRMEDCNHFRVYETEVDGVVLTVFCSPESGLPVRTQAREDDVLLVDITYEEYIVDLNPDPRLFVPSAGLQITEHSRVTEGSVAAAISRATH